MKLKQGLLVILLVASVLAVGACAKSAPAPAPTTTTPALTATPTPTPTPTAKPSPTATPTPTPTMTPVTWKFYDEYPPDVYTSDIFRYWGTELEKRTNGLIKVQYYWMGSLVKWSEGLPAIQKGIADVGIISTTYFATQFPIRAALDMPYNGTDNWAAITASYELYTTDAAMKAEFAKNGVTPLGGWTSGLMEIVSKTPINSVADLKGKKIRSYGGSRLKWLSALGMNPVAMSFADIYDALQRGVIDATETTGPLSNNMKHQEVAKNVYMTNAGMVLSAPISIRTELFNSLPANIKDVLMKLAPDFNNYFAKTLIGMESGIYDKWAKEAGVKIINPSAADIKVLQDTAAQTNKDYLTEQEQKSGGAMLPTWNVYQTLLQKYQSQVATKGYPWAPK